eukprot:TRINITY_DN65400_c0_g1_i1.p1 TRINITY_DN65400_c0_g1~~TRINITY_DN65400_c0_g1_i1.p1  ORF type:complete len:712 (+),score=70.90 TRINITY_DN65400_c0_g1_i1:61-2196(+)
MLSQAHRTSIRGFSKASSDYSFGGDRQLKQRRNYFVFFSLVHVVFLVLYCSRVQIQEHPVLVISSVIVGSSVPLALWIAFEYLRVDSSFAARQSGVIFFMVWLEYWAVLAFTVGALPITFAYYINCATRAIPVWTVWCRVSMAEEAFEGKRMSKYLLPLIFIALIPKRVLFSTLSSNHVVIHLCDRRDTASFIMHIFHNLLYGLACVITWQAFAPMLNALSIKFKPKIARSTYLRAESSWAKSVLQRALVGSLLMLGAELTISCLDMIRIWHWNNDLTCDVASSVKWTHVFRIALIIYAIVDFLSVLQLVGGFQPVRVPLDSVPSGGNGRSIPLDALRRMEASLSSIGSTSFFASPSREHLPVHSPAWDEVVRSLAERSIDVAALLEFYTNLGDWYHPKQHTTNDVVRRAIIPATRCGDRGVSYAAFVQQHGHNNMPHCMVTHDWRNLFVYLVAAVVSDALGYDDYGSIADALSCKKADQVVVEAEAKGVLHRRYWICAFCVNQHKSICGSFPPPPIGDSTDYQRWFANRHDTVSGDPHKCCDCLEPKSMHLAESCEINKFNDMMALLHREVSGFKQIVAIDEHFDVFTRVWCVAELVQAYLSGISQNVCLLSRRALDANHGDIGVYVKLANLTVANCSATCPEDKEDILALIPDITEFDTQLQVVIFGSNGLLGRQLIGFDSLYTAARTALRVRAAANAALPNRCVTYAI